MALFAEWGEGKPFGQPLTHLPSANKGTAGPPSHHLRPGAVSQGHRRRMPALPLGTLSGALEVRREAARWLLPTCS